MYNFTVIIERDDEGYFSYCPQFQGCYSQGDTYEEALINIQDAIKLHIDELRSENETIPQPKSVSMTVVEVAA